MINNIEFISQNTVLRGKLYLPESNLKETPVVIMAHGFTSTINGMTADKYAEEFHKAGYIVLLYDHQNFGVSDGEPRQNINLWIQSKGYISAINFISKKYKTDAHKITIWGASMSAREAFLVGTIDDRISAIITIIPAFGEEIPKTDTSGNLYAFAKKMLSNTDILSLPQTTTELIPIVSKDQQNNPSALTDLSAYNWFTCYGNQIGTYWKNEVSFSNIKTPKGLNIGQFGNQLKAPILMIVATNDEMNGANPEVTKQIYNTITRPKEWLDIGGGHFGLLYYPSPLFDKSSQAQINFLNRYMK